MSTSRNPDGTRIEKKCAACGATFFVHPYRAGTAKSCSSACRHGLRRGKPSWNKGIPNTWYNPKGLAIGRLWNKGKPHPKITGSNHHNWKGGITPKQQKVRTSLGIKIWRQSVFDRDKFSCQACGVKGSYLHAHHILGFALYPKYRTDLDNGITLCKDCHREIHMFDDSISYTSR